MTDYKLLCQKMEGLILGVPYEISNLANASALINCELDRLNWVGFYILKENKLILSAFQGKPACIEIPVGKGVCGTAVKLDKIMNVPDVHKFEGHIACDGDSNSEMVIPLHKDNKIYGVLDIDSPIKERFSENDRDGLKKIAEIIEKSL